MARIARQAAPEGVYYIRQMGNENRDLFVSDADRTKFLELIKESKRKYGFKLYAYCLEKSNAYHLVIHANGSDLSMIMKSLNIAYAMYIRSDKPLFKDRYKSEQILTKCDFDKICSEVVCNKVIGSCFNSESELCDKDDPFKTECKSCIKSSEEALMKLREIAEIERRPLEHLLKDKDRRNALIVEFRKTSLLSLKDIGELFGGLSESSVCKILKSSL